MRSDRAALCPAARTWSARSTSQGIAADCQRRSCNPVLRCAQVCERGQQTINHRVGCEADPNGDPMTEYKLHESISRGTRAEALLQNDLLQEAFVRLEQDYVEAWRVSPARDT